jgi:2-iminobutanoate/2-iminopropanoate deaminase
MTKKIVSTDKAPAAIGPYSQAVRFGDLLFLSGQIPLDPVTGVVVDGGIEAQTERAMLNLKAVVEAAGATMGDVVKTSCFLKDMADFPAFNEVFGRFFEREPPARETVEVSRLPKDVLVEVSGVCGVPGGCSSHADVPLRISRSRASSRRAE